MHRTTTGRRLPAPDRYRYAGVSGHASIIVIALIAIATLALLAWFAPSRKPGIAFPHAIGVEQRQGAYRYLADGQVLFRTLANKPSAATGVHSMARRIQVSKRAAQNAVRSGSLDVQLPDGLRFPVVFDREETSPEGDWTLVGRVPAAVGAAVITFGRDGVFGVLPTPDGRMLQITSIRGESFISPAGGIIPPGTAAAKPDYVVPSQPVRGPGPPSNRAGVASSQGKSKARMWNPPGQVAATTDVRIDVLGLFTGELVTLRGSVAAARTEFTNLIAIANQAHVDSGSVVRMRLVATQQITYPPTTQNLTALSDLQGNALPDGLDVTTLRDRYAADLVAMLRPYAPDHGSCGNGYLGGFDKHPEYASADFGFSVSDTGECGPLVLAHELGHNLGSMHDIATSTAADGSISYGAYPFSFGYRQDGPPAFATVMAYVASNQAWVGYFSNPTNTLCGSPCGVADKADNVRSLNLMARTIARYRDPPNTISIADASVTETDSGSTTLSFAIKLSSPAPVGGVRFDVLTSNGTAAAGSDYLSRSSLGLVIAEGQRSATFDVIVLADENVEPDETMLAVLKNVVGMAVFDGNGVGTIRNDDPRVAVSGRVLFPQNAVPPASPFYVCGYGGSEYPCVQVSAPDFRYSLAFPPGTPVVLHAYPGQPFVDEEIDVGVLDAATTRDINVRLAAILSGRVLTPVNEPALSAPVSVTIQGYDGDPNHSVDVEAVPPGFNFRQAVVPGATVWLRIGNPPAPYVTQEVKAGVVTSNVTRNITLRQIPGIAVDDQSFAEGPQGTWGSWGFGIRLSAPAPAGGVTFDIATGNAGATAGSDYERFTANALTIPQGATFTQISVLVYGDDLPEANESFTVSVSNVHGAWLADAQGAGRILNDDIRKVPSDFNGDGLSDILWRNGRTGSDVIWRSASSAATQAVNAVALAWRIAGTGDFDADGKADILWRNGSTGANTIWRSASNAAVQAVATLTSQDWQAAGIGDFDGDGRADILWRNQATGANAIWKSGNKATPLTVSSLAAPDWQVAGIGDFDADGRADILWRNQSTGANLIWKAANGATTLPVTTRAAAWQVAGIGDFSHDRKADILWRNASTGENVIWRAGNSSVPQLVDSRTSTGWAVAAVGDYNSDGYADILWRNTATGENSIWRMAKSANAQIVSALPDLAWSAAP